MEKKIAILMADLSGFTAMTEMHGSAMAAQMIDKYIALVKSSLKGESFMLERVGDQVVVISPNPDDLAASALTLFQNAKLENHFLPIHAGLHYGDALEIDGHYYGSSMNLTARIASKAKGGKLLCSQDFVDALSDTEDLRYVYHGRFNFKNILESKEIVELLPVSKAPLKEKDVCPVCQMQLDATETNFSYLHEDQTYYFCSQECKDVFISHQLYNVALTS